MVIDTSALMAILPGEADAKRLARTIAADPKRLMNAFSALGAGIVMEAQKGEPGGRELDLLLLRAAVDIVAMDLRQVELARTAWRQYGKGRHPASLNIGDCCAYALSVDSGEPLLFKGEDFTKTDVRVAPQPAGS